MSFLCFRPISVVFRGDTGIYTSLDRVGGEVSPLGWDGVDGAWHHCIGAWVVLGYRYSQYR